MTRSSFTEEDCVSMDKQGLTDLSLTTKLGVLYLEHSQLVTKVISQNLRFILNKIWLLSASHIEYFYMVYLFHRWHFDWLWCYNFRYYILSDHPTSPNMRYCGIFSFCKNQIRCRSHEWHFCMGIILHSWIIFIQSCIQRFDFAGVLFHTLSLVRNTADQEISATKINFRWIHRWHWSALFVNMSDLDKMWKFVCMNIYWFAVN
jgi:hypothetical protein